MKADTGGSRARTAPWLNLDAEGVAWVDNKYVASDLGVVRQASFNSPKTGTGRTVTERLPLPIRK